MPVNWELGFAPKIAGKWDYFPKICLDFGIGRQLTGIVKKFLTGTGIWPIGLKIDCELGLETLQQDRQCI